MRTLLRQVPQLHRLAVFESVARMGTFTAAGRELGISQPAVSRHIAGLEGQLRLVLFDRSAGRPALTSDGTRLHEAVQRTFASLEGSLAELRSGLDVLTIAAQPAVASNWLSPRLDALRDALAPTEPRLVVFQRDGDLETIAHDVSIRFGTGVDQPNMRSVKLLDEVAVPAASPDYADRMGLDATTDPRRLTECELLEFDSTGHTWASWTSWLAAHDVEWTPPDDQVVFPAHASGVAQAVLGRGVILIWRGMRREMFDRGLLVEVGPTLRIAEMGHQLVWPTALSRDEGFHRLHDWLVETAVELA